MKVTKTDRSVVIEWVKEECEGKPMTRIYRDEEGDETREGDTFDGMCKESIYLVLARGWIEE